MSDRCLSLSDDEVRRLLAGASVIVRPFRTQPDPKANRKIDVRTYSDSHEERCPAWAKRWWAKWQIAQGAYAWDMAPLAPGDTMVVREAWRVIRTWMMESKHDTCIYEVEYRADGTVRSIQAMDLWLERHYAENECWRTPQTMPAALSRIRRGVGGVAAVEIGDVDEGTWVDAGFNPRHYGDPNTLPSDHAREWWLSRYGPGSRSGWVWVITVEEVRDAR